MTNSQLCKRLIDITLASTILVLTLPITVAAAVLCLILQGWPIFYISRRCVSPNKTIPVFKFRTMVRDAVSPKYRLAERFMRDGYLDIPLSCEVYTPLGRIMERMQIVELPQMLNVLFHGMSLIGNRPLPMTNVRCLQKYDGWEQRFSCPVGISGISQVVGKLNLEPEQRLALEIAYADCYRTGNVVRCDLFILLYTMRIVFLGTGIDTDEARRVLQVASGVELASGITE
ncbi:MAG: sugar transferase [Bryobacteraceae bacterium]|nr:sugar transferase [Bryobacteraceae bacterium]